MQTNKGLDFETTYSYTYGSRGNVLSISGSRASTIGKVNPIRYRGYVYDTETGLYYLQSRYYNPQTGRFLNADGLASTGQGIIGNNMFAYCGNNSVIYSDDGGCRYVSAIDPSFDGGSNMPVYSLDTNGDSVIDCYIYSYSFNHAGNTISGNVYIYTGRTKSDFDTMPKPRGFTYYSDLMVGDFTNYENATMYAYQAQCVSEVCHESIIGCLEKYDTYFNTAWKRNEQSLHIEWDMHNVFAFASSRAQNVDFDNEEEGKSRSYFVKKAVLSALGLW